MTGLPDPQDHHAADRRPLTEEEQRTRKRRALAMGLALAAFAVLIFVVSLARLYSNIGSGAGA